MQNFNTDKQAFFQQTFYGNINPERPVLQEQGRSSRSNQEGLRTFRPKTQEELKILVEEFYSS
jgi:hypothetical protein